MERDNIFIRIFIRLKIWETTDNDDNRKIQALLRIKREQSYSYNRNENDNQNVIKKFMAIILDSFLEKYI